MAGNEAGYGYQALPRPIPKTETVLSPEASKAITVAGGPGSHTPVVGPSMPWAPGGIYTGPPTTKTTLGSYNERQSRDLEDYISRRVKSRVILDADNQNVLDDGSGHNVEFDLVQYDTASLWDAVSYSFIIPRGAEGDYLFIASIIGSPLTSDDGYTASLQKTSASENGGFPFAVDVDLSVITRRTAKLVTEETMRPGDRMSVSVVNYDVGDVGNYFVIVTGSFFSARRLL